MYLTIHKALIGIGTLGLLQGASGCANSTDKQNPPNVIYILADDLGYGDLGCYGQGLIETPNIDRLAEQGIRFTNHYSGSGVCAPARAVLLTGLHAGRAQVRGNDPVPERGDVHNYLAMFNDPGLEGSHPLEDTTYTLGTMFQQAGFKTAVIGKWGLSIPGQKGWPNRLGFDLFYGYVCQRQAHTYYPLHLYRNEERVFLANDTVAPHTSLPVDADPYDLDSYAPFTLADYAPDLMFAELTQFVEENKSNPFFLYWATPIPHLPLQAPKRWIDYYVEKFGDEKPYTGTPESRGGYFPVRYPRATYAAMISYMDEQIGLLVQQLKDIGIYDNTLIVFTSDNGPSGFYTPFFQSASPFRTTPPTTKGSLYEGGIRVPMIMQWPGKIKPATVTDHISAFYDVMPTFAEVIGADIPVASSGISFLPASKGEPQNEHAFLYWEYPGSGGQLAVRIGNLKALALSVNPANQLKWSLYDLDQDPQELHDIAEAHPEVIQKVNEIVAREHIQPANPNWRYKVLSNE